MCDQVGSDDKIAKSHQWLPFHCLIWELKGSETEEHEKAHQEPRNERYNGFSLTLHEAKLDWPLKNLAKKPERPARCFVTDIGDLLHAKVPDGFIYDVFKTMLKVPQHRFYVLTKKTERLGELGPRLISVRFQIISLMEVKHGQKGN